MRNGISILCVNLVLLFSLTACSIFPEKITSSPQFDNALLFAKISNLSYNDVSTIRQDLSSLGLELKKTTTIIDTDVQYFVAIHPTLNYQVISIRGTANPENVKVDVEIKFIKDDTLGIEVHKGFAKASNELLTDLKKSSSVLDKHLPIIVTGHSLGGAIAVIVGMHLKEMNYKLKAIYTYGQPKLTDRHGAEKYKSIPLIRYANDKDIVPLVPPLSMDQESNWDIYWHLGKEVLLYSDMRYTQLSADASVLRGLASYYDDLFKKRDLDAHSLVNYVNSLQAKTRSSQQIDLKLSP